MAGTGRMMVFKYGPPEPKGSSGGLAEAMAMVIKYGPPEPSQPQDLSKPRDMVIKYGPPKTAKPGAKSKEQKDKEIKAILKQIAACLKKIKMLLGQPETTPEELNSCIAELDLLTLRLNSLGSASYQIVEGLDKKGRSIVILYIVTTPANLAKKKK